jgi:GNAT superfamily N-acetyltransferase
MNPVLLNLNGYTELPPGKIATVVTYLEMTRRPRLPRRPTDPAWHLDRIDGDVARYRALFRRVGEPWLWFSRIAMAEPHLAAILSHPGIEAYALRTPSGDTGLLELDFRSPGQCELQFFGVVPEQVGTGAGRYLMNQAIRRAFSKPVERFFLHTCSLDHPAALPFYIRSGFTPYKRAIEVADDPRLTGRVPLEAAPHIPVIGSAPPPLRVVPRPRSRRS